MVHSCQRPDVCRCQALLQSCACHYVMISITCQPVTSIHINTKYSTNAAPEAAAVRLSDASMNATCTWELCSDDRKDQADFLLAREVLRTFFGCFSGIEMAI